MIMKVWILTPGRKTMLHHKFMEHPTNHHVFNISNFTYRVQDNANEYHIALQEEIDDRGSFQNETDQTVQWLSEAKMELERLDPGKEVADVVERIEKQKVYNDE
jgi:hypothetical protein